MRCSFYAPECLFSSWLYLDFLLMKSSLSSSISRYAPCPDNVLKCSVHRQEGERAELQTVLISYASHVASSTNRRYLIEILITVSTHWRIHTLWHSMTRAMELSSLLAVCGNHAFCLWLSPKRYYFDFVPLKCPTPVRVPVASASTRLASQCYLLSCSLCVCLCN